LLILPPPVATPLMSEGEEEQQQSAVRGLLQQSVLFCPMVMGVVNTRFAIVGILRAARTHHAASSWAGKHLDTNMDVFALPLHCEQVSGAIAARFTRTMRC